MDDLSGITPTVESSSSDTCETTLNTNTSSGPMKKLRSALSMGDLSKALRRNEDSRNLRFSSKVHVCLIPTRQDLDSVAKDVFWHSDDYQTFKREAVDELRTYLQMKGITAKEAIQALYQPQPEEYSFLRSLHVNTSDGTENGMIRSDSSPAVMEIATPSSPSTSQYQTTADLNECNDKMDTDDVNSTLYDSGVMYTDESNEDAHVGDDIKLGFKTDLDMNKELGAIKTPARQGGSNTGAWAVQWQAPMPAV